MLSIIFILSHSLNNIPNKNDTYYSPFLISDADSLNYYFYLSYVTYDYRLVRLLGELYNYSVVSAPVIYELLYTVINYGHLKETVKTNSNSEKDGPGSVVSAVVSVGEAPHRYDKTDFIFYFLFFV